MTNDGSWKDKDPGFVQTYMGHVATSAITIGIPMLVGLWLVSLMVGSERVSFGGMVSAAVVVVLVAEVFGTALHRFFAHQQNHPNPASLWLTVQQILGPAITGYAFGGLFITGLPWSHQWALIAAALGAVIGALNAVLLDKSWKQQISQAEMDEKWQQTREMTRDHFGIDDPRG